MLSQKLIKLKDAEKLHVDEVKKLYSDYVNPYQTKIFSNFSFGSELFDKASGMYLQNDKKKILDFTGGFGVLNHGHNHERILNVRKKFIEENKLEVHKIIFSKYLATLSHNLSVLLDGKLNRTFLCNSGAEAVEGAMKLAFRANKNKKYILSSDKSYHGKLIGSGSISGSYKNKNNFQKIENFDFFNFNDPVSLEKKIIEYENKGGVYAVIIEPFSATLLESCSAEFITKLKDLKKKYNFSIICDEVYCAWYKCGKLFYFKNYDNFTPDILTLSKSMGGGKSSISAYIANEKLHDKVYGSIDSAFLHTTTYNGFGEECATAIEAINILIEEDYQKKVNSIESQIKENLKKIQEKFPKKIKSFRGQGALFGIEFYSPIEFLSKILDNVNVQSVQNKKKIVSKLYIASISDQLFKNYNIMTNISESDNSDFLYISPSLIAESEHINYFFDSLSKLLSGKLDFTLSRYLFKSVLNLIK